MTLRRHALVGALSLAAALAAVVPAAAQKSGQVASPGAPSPDPRVGLRGGALDSTGKIMVAKAAEASWNLKLLSNSPPTTGFVGVTNSDLAFTGSLAIQGSYDGYQVWDISNPQRPSLKTFNLCPASQSDVSVYHNLLFVSSESNSGRLDCGTSGAPGAVNAARIRGVRIFDITDISKPVYITNVQTCRGSHTHTVVTDPNDKDNVYIYVSGSAGVRPAEELAGCSNAAPATDPNSAHFRIEVIKVPLAHPEQAAIVSSPRIFNDLAAPPTHGGGADDLADMETARKAGAYIVKLGGQDYLLGNGFVKPQLDSIVKARGGTGNPTAADSATLRGAVQGIVDNIVGASGPPTGPDQCHDITVYPTIGFAGGACGGYGLLLDIHDPAHPSRIGAASDSNFSYWHSATFSNDGSKVLFSDEWGGGGQPKCRASDKPEWGGDAIFTLENRRMVFQGYYKMSAAQTKFENCVAHNGSLIPVPGRDIMVQAWYQGGISVFDWSNPAHPAEIAFFDRGPLDSTKLVGAGSWSAYWYNGVIVSSEIFRGLDVFELTPSALLSQNEIDAARTVHFDQLNVQDQPKIVWPASFALARAYVDQLERSKGLSAARITAVRTALASAEKANGAARKTALTRLGTQIKGEATGSSDQKKVTMLAGAVTDLAAK
ncbi:MAG TPA: hypothetical protein VHW65_07760 [Gemmatimonadales bacterium]|nr:hypothetical protein [Gemmatimonadales bacterium]